MSPSPLHELRNQFLNVAALRPFRPIEKTTNRLVLVRPDHFGDLLLLAPAVRYLERHLSDHEIVLMLGPWNSGVASHLFPEIRQFTYPFPGFDRSAGSKSMLDPYRAISRAAETLRGLGPRAVALLRDDHWWGGLMAREAGVPLRIGYDHPQVSPFLTHPIAIEHDNYARQNLEVARSTLAVLGFETTEPPENSAEDLHWPLDPQAESDARELLSRHEVGHRYAIIHPGTGAPVKTWPARNWAIVADAIKRQTDAQVLLSGSPDERGLCEEIQYHSHAKLINVAGETSLFSLAELMRNAKLVLGVDSGPLHLAVAAGTSSIHLYGPSDHVRYGPFGDPERHRILLAGMTCPACGDLSMTREPACGCMTAITSAEVSRIAIEMLHEY